LFHFWAINLLDLKRKNAWQPNNEKGRLAEGPLDGHYNEKCLLLVLNVVRKERLELSRGFPTGT
jgi:hypothetical protein